MALAHNTAVEITTGADHVDIWVDANNNGMRDDDDVEIYVTRNGSMYVDSLHLTGPLDEYLKEKLCEAAIRLIENQACGDENAENRLSTIALELVRKALAAPADVH